MVSYPKFTDGEFKTKKGAETVSHTVFSTVVSLTSVEQARNNLKIAHFLGMSTENRNQFG